MCFLIWALAGELGKLMLASVFEKVSRICVDFRILFLKNDVGLKVSRNSIEGLLVRAKIRTRFLKASNGGLDIPLTLGFAGLSTFGQ